MKWDFEVCRCKILYTEWINNMIFLKAQGTIFNIL